MKYLLRVEIKPAEHFLSVSGRILEPRSGAFYLNENFTLLDASLNGAPIGWHFDREGERPAFDEVSRPLNFERADGELAFAYEGYISDILSEVNQIDQGIVELAYYSGWYPKPRTVGERFDFELEVLLPKGYELAANGSARGKSTFCGTGEFDIALFASNQVERVTYAKGGVSCTFLCAPELLPRMETRAKEQIYANELFTRLYGSRGGDTGPTELVSVFRPGGGWPYKRGDVTFSSMEQGREQTRYHDDFHELAHGWWSIAAVETDDWINEGGAEFSALVASRHLYGAEFAREYVAEQIAAIRASEDKTSIAHTNEQTGERFLNHYQKPVVMLLNAQRAFGAARVFALLKSVFETYQGTQNATTDGFLALCGDMRYFFQKYLFAPGWDELKYDLGTMGAVEP